MGIADDINTVARFIACDDIPDLGAAKTVDCIVLCVSSVLYSCERVFNIIQAQPEITKTLVLCGGIGHSTEPIYEAVAKHPRFKQIAAKIKGLPEAQVLHAIYRHFYASQSLDHRAPQILLEDRSVTCATNAIQTRKLLETHAIVDPESMIIIQDPTMVRRTVECFKKAYEDATKPPRFQGCPVFVPLVGSDDDDHLLFTAPHIPQHEIWPMNRYLELVMGEIPRMRDNQHGYGPNGRGVIPHVDIPDEVESAYSRLYTAIPHRRYKFM